MTGPAVGNPDEKLKEKHHIEVVPFIPDQISPSKVTTIEKDPPSQKSGRENIQPNLKSNEDYQLKSALFGYEKVNKKSNLNHSKSVQEDLSRNQSLS